MASMLGRAFRSGFPLVGASLLFFLIDAAISAWILDQPLNCSTSTSLDDTWAAAFAFGFVSFVTWVVGFVGVVRKRQLRSKLWWLQIAVALILGAAMLLGGFRLFVEADSWNDDHWTHTDLLC